MWCSNCDGALLALFPVDKLALDSRATPEVGQGGIRFSIIITVDEPGDVDALAARVREAGGAFTKEPTDAEFFEGRDAYFSDPEGNFWEIAWTSADNPVVLAARRAAGLSPDDLQSEVTSSSRGRSTTNASTT